MRAAINASPLIFLARLNMLHLLDMYSKVYSTHEVLSEVLGGIEAGYHDALLAKKFINGGKIRRVKTKARLEKYEELLGLHKGEISVLLVARELKLDLVIVDDKRAIKAAKYFGLKPVSTPFVLLEALRKGKLTFSRFKECMDRLIEFGYRISPRLYISVLERAEGFAKAQSGP
jgi:predicted nucleic acid-binding protein